jgi:uncharacterized protein YecA (UPF0149 family)
MGAFAEGFAISQICYNLALLPDVEREKTLSEVRSKLEMSREEFDDFQRSLLVPMIQRHREMFPLLHRRAAAGLSPSGPPLQSAQGTGARTEKYPGTGRYAPCPCDSGKKYKFCCGAKGR